MTNIYSTQTLAIPELIHEIADKLDLHDLAQLVRVNKEWYNTWTPYLWCDIKILTAQQRAAFMEPTAQEALVRHRHLVRLLWCRTYSCTNLLAALDNTNGQQQKQQQQVLQQLQVPQQHQQKLQQQVCVLQRQQQQEIKIPHLQLMIQKQRQFQQQKQQLIQQLRDQQQQFLQRQQLRQQLQPLNLKDIYFWTEAATKDDKKEFLFKSLMNVLGQSPHLVILDVTTPPPVSVGTEYMLMCIAMSLPRLQRLTLFLEEEPYVQPYTVKEFLETVSAELEYLSVGIKFGHGKNPDTTATTATTIAELKQPVKESRPHPKLKCFSLFSNVSRSIDKTIVPLVLCEFLKGCVNLEIVDDRYQAEMFDSWIWDFPDVMRTLESVMGVRLRRVHLQPEILDKETTDNAMKITSMFAGTGNGNRNDASSLSFHTIQIDKHSSVAPFTNTTALSAALARVQPYTSSVISISRSESLKGSYFLTLLCQGRNLRCLSSTLLPTIRVTEMMSSQSWSCRWITTLLIQISGIPRPDIFTDYKNRLAPTLLGVSMKQSRAIQRKVYAQLGQLTVLRCLELGACSPERDLEVGTDRNGKSVFFDRRMQLSCLEMTLESGLDLLSGLRDLKRLSVENMDHRIGVAEMLWMSKAWPNIRRVKGLVSCREGGDLCGRMVPSLRSVIGPGRDCGSKMDVLSCGDVNFEFS